MPGLASERYNIRFPSPAESLLYPMHTRVLFLCSLALLLTSCGRREMSPHEACALMKDHTGFDPAASGYAFRHRYLAGREWTFYGTGTTTMADGGDILKSLGLDVPTVSCEPGTFGLLKTACEAVGTPEEVTILYDRDTRVASRSSLRAGSAIYVAANREKRWFAICILHF